MKRLFNFFRDHIFEYLLILIILGGVFYLAFSKGSFAKPNFEANTLYVDKIFDNSFVHKIEIDIESNDYASLLENPREKLKYRTNISVDGEVFENVALSTRGNGSLGDVARDEESERYSYTLNFSKFNDKGTYYGLDKLVLNNLYSDESYLKNFLAFKIAAASGADTPYTSFVDLYINGEHRGLYLAIESVSKSFLERTTTSKSGALFHPLPYNVDADRIYRDFKYLPEGEYIDQEAHPDSSNYTYGGSDLVYRGDDAASYSAIFENASTKYSRKDEAYVIEAIEALSGFSDLNPADYWDVDAVIKFFVSNAFAPNSDSYVGYFAQNYYLKLSNGKLSVIPWDFDRAFHLGIPDEKTAAKTGSKEDKAVTLSIDTPLLGYTEEERPLWQLISTNPDYMEKYHAELQDVLDNYLLNGKCREDFDSVAELIRSYVYSDPTRFSSTEDFESEVEYLRRFIVLRADSIQKQLWDLPLDSNKKDEQAPTNLHIVEE